MGIRHVALALLLVAGACDRGDGRDLLRKTPAPTATTAPATTTTTSPPAVSLTANIQLETDGLGVVPFGTPAAETIDRLRSLLGETDERLGPFGPGDSPWGVCPGDRVSGHRWGRFTVVVTEGQTEVRADGAPHFSAYYFGWPTSDPPRPNLQTDAGIGIGSTVAELKEAYGAQVDVHRDELVGPAYAVGDIDDYPYRIFGGLTSTADDGRVTHVSAGVLCGE